MYIKKGIPESIFVLKAQILKYLFLSLLILNHSIRNIKNVKMYSFNTFWELLNV